MNKKKLMFGVAATALVIGVTPTLLQRLGWIGPLHRNAVAIVLLTGAGLLLKLYVADIAADGEFLFYKNGYDNCIVVFGATLTAVALQAQSDLDLFPGLATIPVLNALGPSRILQLVVLWVAALLASLHTAHVAGDIRRSKKPERGFWAFLNSLIGVAMLATYVLILISKG